MKNSHIENFTMTNSNHFIFGVLTGERHGHYGYVKNEKNEYKKTRFFNWLDGMVFSYEYFKGNRSMSDGEVFRLGHYHYFDQVDLVGNVIQTRKRMFFSIINWLDRSEDERYNSHFAFGVMGVWDAKDLIELFKIKFPEIHKRFKYELIYKEDYDVFPILLDKQPIIDNKIDSYWDIANKFNICPEENRKHHAIVGLSGEVGELCNEYAKHYYKGKELTREKIMDECGDVYWYLCYLMSQYGIGEEEMKEYNLNKLKERYKK